MRIAENPEYSEQIDFHVSRLSTHAFSPTIKSHTYFYHTQFNCRLNETLQEDFDLSNELVIMIECFNIMLVSFLCLFFLG